MITEMEIKGLKQDGWKFYVAEVPLHPFSPFLAVVFCKKGRETKFWAKDCGTRNDMEEECYKLKKMCR